MSSTQQHSENSNAIALRGALPLQPLAKIEEVRTTFNALQAKVNLICPLSQVDHIMPMHQVSFRAVDVNPDVKAGDVYKDQRFCEDNERALGKIALTKLMSAAGVQIISSDRIDDRSDPCYCEFKVVLAMRDFDGQYRQIVASKESDFRDGAPEASKPQKRCKTHGLKSCNCDWRNFEKTGELVPLDASALADKRRHIESLTETKAIERGLRLILNLKQKYTVEELRKPFVVPKLVPFFDTDDPDVKKALIQHTLAGEQALFGPAPQPTFSPDRALPPAERRNPPASATDTGANEAADQRTEGPIDNPAEDLSGFEAPPPEPEREADVVYECGCTCSHVAEISKEVYDKSIELCGSPRCQLCYPYHPSFDFSMHDSDKALGIKAWPQLTPRKVKEQRAAQKAHR